MTFGYSELKPTPARFFSIYSLKLSGVLKDTTYIQVYDKTVNKFLPNNKKTSKYLHNKKYKTG